MSDKRRYMALDLVSHEIQETLSHVLQDLNSFIQYKEDITKLRFSLTYLHQVAGSLTMIEYHGAALLAKEIEGLLSLILSNTMTDEKVVNITDTSIRCIEALSSHIKQVINTGEDNPNSLLKPLNSIRAISQSTEGEFSLSDMFNPDISRKAKNNLKPSVNSNEFHGIVRKLRQHFQRCLIHILKGEQLEQNHEVIKKVTQALFKSSNNTASEPFWEAAFALADYFCINKTDLNTEHKKALRIIDSQFKQLEKMGSKGLMQTCEPQQFKSLLYSIAIADNPTHLMQALIQQYNLSEALQPKHNDVSAIKSVSNTYRLLIDSSRDALFELKDTIVDYVANDWDATYIENSMTTLKEMAKELSVEPFKALQPICEALSTIIQENALRNQKKDWEEVELIADIISAADYYLECIAREEMKNLGDIIRGAYEKLDVLGYTSSIGSVDFGSEIEADTSLVKEEKSWVLADDIDEDIFDIFLEESQEVFDLLKGLLPKIQQTPNDHALLTDIRRSWHTLKGSGRMVGADQIGDFAWALENMLNQILSGNLSLSDNRLSVLEKAINLLPLLIGALTQKDSLDPAIPLTIMNEADQLSRLDGDSINNIVSSKQLEAKPSHETINNEYKVDSELFDIFINEAETHLDVFIRFLNNIEPDVGSDGVVVTQELQRAFHTLKGSSHMAGIEPVAVLVTPMEAFIKDLNNFNIKADQEILTLFFQASEFLQQIVEELKQGKQVSLEAIDAFKTNILVLQEKKVDSDLENTKNYYDTLLSAAITHLTSASEIFEQACIESITIDQKNSAASSLFTLSEIAKDNKSEVIAELSFALATLYAEHDMNDQDFLSIRSLLEQGHEALDDMFDAFAAHQDPEPRAELLASLHTASHPKEHEIAYLLDNLEQEIKNADSEVLGFFIEEAGDLGEQLSAVCNDWVVSENDLENISATKHILHTLKGGARLTQISTLADVAYEFEKHIEHAELYKQFDQKFFMGIKHFQSILEQEIAFLIQFSHSMSSHDFSTDQEEKSLPTLDSQVDQAHLVFTEPVTEVIDTHNHQEETQQKAGNENYQTTYDKIEPSQSDGENTSKVNDLKSTENQIAVEPVVEQNVDTEVVMASDTYHQSQRLTDNEERIKIIDWQQLSLECQQADEETFSFFIEEAEELIQQFEVAANNQDKIANPFEYCSALKRILHTIKGGARLTELSALGDLTHEYESMIELAERQEAFNDHFFAQVMHYLGILQQSLDVVFQGGQLPDEPIKDDIAIINVTASQLIDDYAHIDMTALDSDLVELFIEEAEDQLESLENCIADFLGNSKNIQPLEELKRLLHTLKGGARLAGISDIGNICHDYETFIIKAEREKAVDNDKFIDSIQNYYEDIAQRLSKVKDYFVQIQDAEDKTEAIQISTSGRSLTQAAIDATKNFFHKLSQQKKHQKREPIKVAAGLLENLINLAGESSIGRSRIEEQVNDLNFSVDEMDSTVDRLHNQLRRLEIETEAQIVFRQEQVVSEGQENFDPLEMDRYTHMQQLSKSLIESASDLDDITETFNGKMRDLETLLLQQSRLNSELQEGLMSAQMVPFSRMVPRLRRIVRQTATELNKKVEFSVVNADGEMDRTVLEKMIAPLEHMLRNAVDHGIESPEERMAKGKKEQGSITLTLLREGGEIIIVLNDDGAGVNLKAVRLTAEKRGLLSPSAEISDHEICQFILHSGFSTAKHVTQISGRGVGMDVVHSEIKQMGGSVEINSSSNGSCFTVRLPFTVSVNRALMVCIGTDTYAIPLNTIEGIVRISPYELENYSQPDAGLFEYAGQSYHLRYLGTLLNKTHKLHLERLTHSVPVVLIRSNDYSVAVHVDNLLGSQEIVVKSLGPQFSMVEGLSGATVLGDGSVVVILDMQSLIRSDISRGFSDQVLQDNSVDIADDIDEQLLVMVVDDSVTVRKVTSRLLERHDISVVLAKDGLDAMNQLQEMDKLPNLMLLDIEMPRMDGFEVVNRVRHSDRLKDIAICMITSRTGDKHRQRALSLGANEYLGKPFQETELLETIEKLTEDVLV